MTDMVKVKVLRAHSGNFGQKVEGATYETTRAHANALVSQNNLVEIIGPAKAEPALANKAEGASPETKSEISTIKPAAKPAKTKG